MQRLVPMPAVFTELVVLLLLANFAAAEEGENGPTEQIVVVAHKDERSIREIAANVTVLSRTDLTNQLATSVADAFRYVPGVDCETAGTRFGTEGISIRGIGGNRVAIQVDGVPLADQFDTGSFSNATRDFIDAGMVQAIEVLHGPASALYGSSAIGGVVALRTPDPADIAREGGAGGDALVTWRSVDNSANGQAMVALGDNGLGLLAGYSRRAGEQTDSAAATAKQDSRDYERETALLKFVADNRWGQTLRMSFIHHGGRAFSRLESMLGSGRYRSTTALEGDDRQQMNLLNVAFEFGVADSWIEHGIARAFWQQSKTEQYTLDERAAARTPVSIDRFFAFDQEIRGLELNLWKTFRASSVSHRLGFGAEVRQRATEEYRDGMSTELTTGGQTNVLLGEVFPLRDFPVSDTTETAAFIEDTISFGDRWTVIAAVRADRFELDPDVDAMYLADYPEYETTSLDESDYSPKLGIIYGINTGLDAYVQYSHGFRAPPYSDANVSLELPLFQIRAVPNPDLRSESSDGVDIGLRWYGAQVSAHLSAFYTRYEDFIETKVNIGVDPESGYTLFQSQNIEDTTIKGIEAGWRARFGRREQFKVDGAAYIAKGHNGSTGQPLNSVGPAQGAIGVAWLSRDESRELRLKGTFTDAYDRLDETRGELFKPSGYAVFDFYVTQKIGNNAIVRAGLHNLTDRTYWNWSDVRGLAPDDPVLPYLAQAGRSASVSLNLVW